MSISGRSRAAFALIALFAASPALAADRATVERLRELEGEVAALTGQVEEIRVNFTERSGLIGVKEARERYEQAVYLYLVGDYTNAATSFYILVQSRALGNADLARDSEWYLAECLFEMGNIRTAEEAYRAIVERGTAHPYFPDAVRRALEVYGILGETEAFDRYYNNYILTGKVKPTDLINYTLAKSFYRRGERARAKSMFEALPAESPYYTRARYFLGVLMILEKNYDQAIQEYKLIEAAAVADDEHRQVLELAQLALARLHYETGNFAEATVYYSKIGKGSPYFADQLYEAVWTYIRQENWAEARNQVDIFLLAFPEHRYTSDLKLLQSHLHMKMQSYDDARAGYERVVDEYSPMVERLEAISGGPDEMRGFLSNVTRARNPGATQLPGFAVEMLLGRDDVARAAGAWQSTELQKDELSQGERIVQELELALTGSQNVLGTFLAARTEVSGVRNTIDAVRDRLIETELNYLRPRVPTQLRSEISQLQKERVEVFTELASSDAGAGVRNDRVQVYDEQVREVQQRAFRVSQVAQESLALAASTTQQVNQSRLAASEAQSVRGEIERQQAELQAVVAQLEQLQGEAVRRNILRTVEPVSAEEDTGKRSSLLGVYADLRKRTNGYRRYATDADAAAIFAQVDRIWAQLDTLEKSAGDTARVLAAAEARETSTVRTRLAAESQRVVELRRNVERSSADTEALALRVLRGGLENLEDEFRSDVLEADKGIVDVYWLRKTGASDEMQALAEEQSKLLRELDEKYRIVRENLER